MGKELTNLKSMDKSAFFGNYEATIVEQWKICVDAANGITEKRNAANSILVTVNTALFAVITFSLDFQSALLSAAGISICIVWIFLLKSYRALNKVKFDIINEIEEMLPLSPFKTEWYRLEKEENYTGLTKIEKALPIIFIILYIMAILFPFCRLFFLD